jgi:hypothetical protein
VPYGGRQDARLEPRHTADIDLTAPGRLYICLPSLSFSSIFRLNMYVEGLRRTLRLKDAAASGEHICTGPG